MVKPYTSTILITILISISLLMSACSGAPAPTENANDPASNADNSSQESLDLPPPAVPNASAASVYSGETITYYSDVVGQGAMIDKMLADQFTKDTGVQITIVPKSADTTDNYDQYINLFQNESPDIDVVLLDIIWTASLAPHLLDLTAALGEEATLHYASNIENNTIDGKLVALPWFIDFGMLYYRTDLLTKYGFDHPPTTWDELETMAKTIQDGEQQAGNLDFAGFVFQAAVYEGATCNSLEWLASQGGGKLIEDGKVTLNNPAAIQALDRARQWVGSIAPPGVISFREEETRKLFQDGNAAFMRNWPYAYAMGNAADSPIKGRFAVAPLPHNEGIPSVAIIGGWELGVSAYSEHKEAATEYVRYLTSPEVQKWRAIVGSYTPSIPIVAQDPAVLEVIPFLDKFQNVEHITRPSREVGTYYTEVSNTFFFGVYEILSGKEAKNIVPQMERDIQAVLATYQAEK
jgi:trehalose/maltose transport system substrate-binding protein